MYLPFVAPYCWVDMLVQELLRLQFMYTKHSEKLKNLLALQWLQAGQQRGFNGTYVLVQCCKTSWGQNKFSFLLHKPAPNLNIRPITLAISQASSCKLWMQFLLMPLQKPIPGHCSADGPSKIRTPEISCAPYCFTLHFFYLDALCLSTFFRTSIVTLSKTLSTDLILRGYETDIRSFPHSNKYFKKNTGTL